MTFAEFSKAVWKHYAKHKRDMPWRNTRDPYKILVSEVMLQQTQVERVIPRYTSFLKLFPTFKALAEASTSAVLREWQGLGYNRRALNLKRTAEIVARDFGGKFPKDIEAIKTLPGVGPYTRGAVLAFAFDIPTAIIETNIRTVFIHHFFPKSKKVADTDLMPFIEKTLDRKNPREWHYALMDYGAYLKSVHPNPSRTSAHHSRQSAFKGSNREQRAKILRFILEKPRTEKEIMQAFVTIKSMERQIRSNLDALEKEGFIRRKKDILHVR